MSGIQSSDVIYLLLQFSIYGSGFIKNIPTLREFRGLIKLCSVYQADNMF